MGLPAWSVYSGSIAFKSTVPSGSPTRHQMAAGAVELAVGVATSAVVEAPGQLGADIGVGVLVAVAVADAVAVGVGVGTVVAVGDAVGVGVGVGVAVGVGVGVTVTAGTMV